MELQKNIQRKTTGIFEIIDQLFFQTDKERYAGSFATSKNTKQTNIERRVKGVKEILLNSDSQLFEEDCSGVFENSTGFQAMYAGKLEKAIKCVLSSGIKKNKPKSFDLMCGNGGFALMSAAVGFPSYGIDINPYLIRKARENLKLAVKGGFIDKDIPCKFAVGNIHQGKYLEEYFDFAMKKRYRETSMPVVTPLSTENRDPYQELGVSLDQADLIYAFPWSEHMPFLLSFLKNETKNSAIYLLPHYESMRWNEFDLKCLGCEESMPFFIGKRRAMNS